MARTFTVAQLERGDRFHFPGAPEAVHTVTGHDTGSTGYVRVRASVGYGSAPLWDADLTLPATASIVATERLRNVETRCVRCQDRQLVATDTADQVRVAGVLCDGCFSLWPSDDEARAELAAARSWRYAVFSPSGEGDPFAPLATYADQAAGVTHLATADRPLELWTRVHATGQRLNRIPVLVATGDGHGAIRYRRAGLNRLAA